MMRASVTATEAQAVVGRGSSDPLEVIKDPDEPISHSLYEPQYEHGSCGVGCISRLDGSPSHDIVADGLTILEHMTHRGACCEGNSGDGAGITTAIPHDFFTEEVKACGIDPLPERGRYAVGFVFLPHGDDHSDQQRKDIKAGIGALVLEYGLIMAGWRKVPVCSDVLGGPAAISEPCCEQFFVYASSNDTFEEHSFSRNLYYIRKRATHELTDISRKGEESFYICSLSITTIVYKGQLTPGQLGLYYPDLVDARYMSHFALIHSRFSTNTFPSWSRAQPLRIMCHNGEINTLRGNVNWMRAREGLLSSQYIDDEELKQILPVVEKAQSDSGCFDNVLEFISMMSPRKLPAVLMMMQPEAWEKHETMSPQVRSMYEYMSCLMEPWDGPALVAFTDGRVLGCQLDRNGLRPGRYWVTRDGRCILASEVGVLPSLRQQDVIRKGRVAPGRMFLIDFDKGHIADDRTLKASLASEWPFDEWLDRGRILIKPSAHCLQIPPEELSPRLVAAGWSQESLDVMLIPMLAKGKGALGSMGNDSPLASLSLNPRLIFGYFKQLFAQVTNPPIDPIRESIVMSLGCYVGPSLNILSVSEQHCQRIYLPHPVLSPGHFASLISSYDRPSFSSIFKLDASIPISPGHKNSDNDDSNLLTSKLRSLAEAAVAATLEGCGIILLSDRAAGHDSLAVPSLLAVGAVHQALVKAQIRAKVAIIVEAADARETHHFCLLIGYGADAVFPYLVYSVIEHLLTSDSLPDEVPGSMRSVKALTNNYLKACQYGIMKVMAKMGISTLSSYKGAQIFEAVGLAPDVIALSFTGTVSRLFGRDLPTLFLDFKRFHRYAYGANFAACTSVLPVDIAKAALRLPSVGDFHWRDGGELHLNSPDAMAALLEATRLQSQNSYDVFADATNTLNQRVSLRGLLDFRRADVPLTLDDVEPAKSIVRRFATGAMSYGSISKEAHETLAIAMNRIGAKSNTGEGGEDPSRSQPDSNGDSRRSAIKQVASGRFGVTIDYLADAEEIQIKMAQGAKPGEGGELPGHKVSASIATTRHSTPGVGLISPPPHHDIYSIEDLAQLIFDLGSTNKNARINVKLVSEVGVGIIAAGVAKAGARVILISGHDGGTGAALWTGVHNCGLPWELGIAETQQTLVHNGLRGSVTLQTDGQLKTGRDVAVAALLGAEEYGFSTAPLVSLGCVMMRKCHLNTCPVGIATQDPELREKFSGTPENVINYFFMIAEEMRTYMASMGFRTVDDMIGRSDMLKVRSPKDLGGLNLKALLMPSARFRKDARLYCSAPTRTENWQDPSLVPYRLVESLRESEELLRSGGRLEVAFSCSNLDRAIGTRLSYHMFHMFGPSGPKGEINVRLTGSAGQSCGAWLSKSVTLEIEGDCNDYVGKGLSGGRLIVYPFAHLRAEAMLHIIVGNVALYGATSGKAFFSGKAAERFCVRNSGAYAVVEGCGDHGCEYMTGGRVVVLGTTGRNFAAGMSGGIAYVWDPSSTFAALCDTSSVILGGVDVHEDSELKSLIAEHAVVTASEIAKALLARWEEARGEFVRVLPTDFKKYLDSQISPSLSKIPLPNGHDEVKDIEELVNGDVKRPKNKVLSGNRLRAFIEYERVADTYRPAIERIKDDKEIYIDGDGSKNRTQASRCMDCGTPFCQGDSGCPISNLIPEWNELVRRDKWREALDRLLLTNNFPEFTGRICPAPCEGACVAGLIDSSVTIKNIEWAIVNRGFQEGWIVPRPPKIRTSKRVSIVGSGPAGLAAADQLNKMGHNVTVFERDSAIGGLLVFGIPRFKLAPSIVARRVRLLEEEGVKFVTNTDVGSDSGVSIKTLKTDSDAILLAIGSTIPRRVQIPGADLHGIHVAMDFLHHDKMHASPIDVAGKRVVVIGAGDTGCDVIATAIRLGAKSIINLALYPEPPRERDADINPWPEWPKIYKVEYGHSESASVFGKDPREYSVLTKCYEGDSAGNVTGVRVARVEWRSSRGNRREMNEIPDSEMVFPADIVFLAIGFQGPDMTLPDRLSIASTQRGNIAVRSGNGYATATTGVFAAGDCRRGQSLVVWAIHEGRQAANEINAFITNRQ